MIINKEPMKFLTEIFVNLQSEGLNIYKESMDEDGNSVPDSYLVLRTEISNTPKIYGDGEVCIRSVDCEVSLISKGIADEETHIHNLNKKKIKNVLKNNNIAFSGVNLGYLKDIKSTEYIFTFKVDYCEQKD